VYREQVREERTPKKMPSGVAVISVKAPVELCETKRIALRQGAAASCGRSGAATDEETRDNAGASAACEVQ
jgi:hypothetical protein